MSLKLYDEIIKERGGVIEKHDPASEHSFHLAPKKRARWKLLLYLFCVVLLLGGLFAYGVFRASAVVTIDMRKVPFVLEKTLLTVPHEKLATKESLHFQAMITDDKVSREVFGDRLTEVHTKATGKAVFVNEYSSKPVTLKKGTTLTGAENNKKYTLNDAVTVPGFKTVEGKRVAGTSPAIGFTASVVGKEYNSEGTDLAVAGYTTGDKAKKFYGKSSGPITGGQSGTVHTVSEAGKIEITSVLQQLLAEKLKRQARAQTPEGFITFPDFQFMLYDTATLTLQSDAIKFPASLSGTLVTYLFPEAPLAAAIAAKAVENGSGGAATGIAYTIPELSGLTLSQGLALSINTEEIPSELTLRVSGESIMRAELDRQVIQDSLVGKPVAQFEKIMEAFPGIAEARFTRFPFWAPYFPNNPERIKLIIK